MKVYPYHESDAFFRAPSSEPRLDIPIGFQKLPRRLTARRRDGVQGHLVVIGRLNDRRSSSRRARDPSIPLAGPFPLLGLVATGREARVGERNGSRLVFFKLVWITI